MKKRLMVMNPFLEGWLARRMMTVAGKEEGKGKVGEVNAIEEKIPSRGCKGLQLCVMVLLVVLVSLLMVCMCYSIQSAPRLALTHYTESVRKEVLDSTVDYLDQLFRWNGYGLRSLAEMLERDLLGDCGGVDSLAKIRAASWSLLKAIPLITSIGVASASGVTGIYSHGGLLTDDLDEVGTPVFMYVNETGAHRPHYVESVDATSGEAIEVEAREYALMEHISKTRWYRSAMSIPAREIAWHLETDPQSEFKVAEVQPSGPFLHSSIRGTCGALKQTAVVHCSRSAKAVTDFLSATLNDKGVEVIVTNKGGDVVFSSECLSRSRCRELSDLGGILSFIKSHVDMTDLVKQEIHYADAQIGGRLHFVDVWPRSFHGFELAVVLTFPRPSVWQFMDTQTRLAVMAIPVLVLGLGVLVGSLMYQLMDKVATELKLRRELFQQLEGRRKAEASRDAKTAFLSHMSHELRTPMSCIIGLLESLLGDLRLSEHESSVRQVHRCATSLVALLNSALDLAKVEAGKLELEKREFDLEAELSALVDVFSVQCDAKGLHHLSLQLSDSIPKLLWGDPARVIQIFTNLLGNSIKFTKQGRIIVRGRVEENEQPAEDASESSSSDDVTVFFEVDDSGSGIDKANRDKVFENFVQADVSTTRTHGGSGLGLGIVRSLVQLMGGDIKIGDKVGNGTVVQFSLRFQARSWESEREFDLLKSRHIVLGMPENDSRDIVATWLEDRGLSVCQVNTWEDVLIHMEALPLALYGKVIEKASAEGMANSLLTRGVGTTLPGTVGWQRLASIRRSKSDGTRNPRGEKPLILVDISLLPPFLDENEYLGNLEKIGFPLKMVATHQARVSNLNFDAIVWIAASNTPPEFKRALKYVNRSLVVKRPLHPSRLRDMFQQLEMRQHLNSVDGLILNRLPSPIRIARHLTDDGESDVTVESGNASAASTPASSWELGLVGPVREDSNEGESLLQQSSSTASAVKSSASPSTSQVLRLPIARSFSGSVATVGLLPFTRSPAKVLQQMDILVAEDHPLLRRLATSMLRKLGASPHEALDGQEAFKLVVSRLDNGQRPFHCILMDCQMPVMDGFEACKAIREFEEGKQHTWIVALTANAMQADEDKCFAVGMDAFLSKPIQQDNLIRVIQSAHINGEERSTNSTENSA